MASAGRRAATVANSRARFSAGFSPTGVASVALPTASVISISGISYAQLFLRCRPGMMHLRDVRFALVSEQLWMDVMPLVLCCFVYFHPDAMRVGPGVLADAGDLPGNLHARLAGLDGETSICDFRRDPGLGGLANGGELIAEIRVQSLEPRRHRDDGCAAGIGDDSAVVNVFHVRRFDEGMVEILSRRVERMVDFERATGFGESSKNVHVTIEIAGKGIGPVAAHGVDTISINPPSPGARKGSDAVAPFDAVASVGRDTGAASARRAACGASIRCYATPSSIVNASTFAPKRQDAGPAGTDRGRRAAVGGSAPGGNSRTSEVGAGQRLRAPTADCGMIRRRVGDLDDRAVGAGCASAIRQGNRARRTRSSLGAGGTSWTSRTCWTGRASWTLWTHCSYRHISRSGVRNAVSYRHQVRGRGQGGRHIHYHRYVRERIHGAGCSTHHHRGRDAVRAEIRTYQRDVALGHVGRGVLNYRGLRLTDERH